MPEKNETNKVRLIGEVISEFTFNHEVFGEKFYFVSLSVTRLSGQVDVIPISISERLMDISVTTKRMFRTMRKRNIRKRFMLPWQSEMLRAGGTSTWNATA